MIFCDRKQKYFELNKINEPKQFARKCNLIMKTC